MGLGVLCRRDSGLLKLDLLSIWSETTEDFSSRASSNIFLLIWLNLGELISSLDSIPLSSSSSLQHSLTAFRLIFVLPLPRLFFGLRLNKGDLGPVCFESGWFCSFMRRLGLAKGMSRKQDISSVVNRSSFGVLLSCTGIRK